MTTNGSNYSRVIKQRWANPVMYLGIACPTGAASWLLATHVAWGASANFTDLWLGLVSVIVGIGAVCAGVGGVLETIDAVNKTLLD
jgi:hypothetical protein